jgi:HK97 family phage major capsid protein
MNKIEELRAKHTATLEAVRDIAAKVEADSRDFTDEERDQITNHMKEVDDLQKQIKTLDADADLRKRIEGLGPVDIKSSDVTQSKVKGTIGDQFAAHLAKSLEAFGGQLSEHTNVRGAVSPLLLNGGMKALVTGDSTTSGGAFVTPQDLGMRDTGTFQRPLTIRDLVTNGTTNSDSVEYVRITGFTNSASPTPEATATSGSSGLKPESAMTFERVSAPGRTIAHWVPMTRRALSDAGQVRTIVDNFLRYGLEEAVEDQVINGTGTGEDFEGLDKLADDNEVQDQAYSTDLLTTTRKARTLVRTVGRAVPTAYAFHPADWEKFDLLTNDTAGNFYFGGPRELGQPRLWGLPVVESEALDEGVGYIADWRQAVLWDREQASVTVGTIDDQFVRNIVTILAEMRAAFGVFRPAAFVRIDLTA